MGLSNFKPGENQTVFTKAGEADVNTAVDAKSVASGGNTALGGAYSDPELAVVDGPGGNPVLSVGTQSIFNPLYTFRYAKFAKSGNNYDRASHRDQDIRQELVRFPSDPKNPTAQVKQFTKLTENPTASKIIEWAQSTGKVGIDGETLAPTPFQWNDFLWCKWYGKIPNNRLLTLRRYPIPVEDNLQIATGKGPLVPLAQAVTWWGGETGNSLDKILGIDYGFNWDKLTAEASQVITGNEISASDVLSSLGIENNLVRQLLLSSFASDPNKPFAATGYDQILNDWAQKAYGQDGAYWNRMLGPVNVINKTQIRGVGYNYTQTISMSFTYKLRSFNSINPKIAMLDLISNFLTLTYNRASFWGGSFRFFQKPGYLLAGLPTGDFEQGNFTKGIVEFLKAAIEGTKGKYEAFSRFLGEATQNVATGDFDAIGQQLEESPIIRDVVASQVRNLMRVPYMIRSILDGRAVGEWHLTVGNPMNPIAVIGNLCLKSTTIKFSDAVGLDDFPSEITFTVTLEPGRPRAKQDIESMFNLGGGDMFYTTLAPPSTARNSYGEYNTGKLELAYQGSNEYSNQFKDRPSEARVQGGASVREELLAENPAGGVPANQLEDNIKYVFGPRVTRAYGSGYGTSPILVDYFRDLKTKD